MVAKEPQRLNQQDLDAPRQEWFYKPPAILLRPWKSLLKDERDLSMIYLMFNILTITFPLAYATLFLLPASNWIGLGYFIINNGLFLQRFVLWLHFSSHRPTYKNSRLIGRALNALPPCLIAPFFGIPTNMYQLHHLVMHHTENNVFPYDLSSTEPYQRDSFVHFLHYWLRFMLAAWFELPYFTWRKSRYDLFWKSALSEVAWISVISVLYTQVNPTGTLWVFVYPYLVTSFALMFGNWSQHIFIHPDRPRSNYGLTMNCINTVNNQRTFNDGYHILHHQNSRTHWSELPDRFNHADVQELLRKEEAIVVDGLWFDDVGLWCMLGRLDRVADRLVWFGQQKRPSNLELVGMLRDRLKPLPLSYSESQ